MSKIIEVSHLTKKFGDFAAVNDISFSVDECEIFGFLGANGAGKSTAMRMLSGLSRPTSGKGTVVGFDINNESEQIKRNIGYMCQKFSLYNDLTVRENIRLFGGIYGVPTREIAPRAADLLEKLGIADKAGAMVGSLPLGEKQKLAFAVTIFHHPKLVFLDEPTGGVDPYTRRRFWEMIYAAVRDGITVFVTTHYMDEAEYCDRVSMMVDGEIRALDTPANLKRDYEAESMDEVFHKIALTAKRS